jgi:hypothetical protein
MRHTWTRRHAAYALTILAIFGTGACSNDTPTDDGSGALVACTTTSSVALTASAGTTPKFTWSPNCTVAGLFVQRVSDGANMWTLSTTTSPLRSGITYGTARQFSTGSNASPLVAGVQYRVGLVSSLGAEFATKLFTP